MLLASTIQVRFLQARWRVVLGLWLVLCACGTTVRARDAAEDRLAVFDVVWQVVGERYYDPQLRGVDWAAQRAKYRPQAAQARDNTEFYAVLRQMINALQDSHTRIFAPSEKFDWQKPRYIGVGLTVREIAGQPVVVSVESDTAAARAGLRVGDVIDTIDDSSALEVFARRQSEQAASTPMAARLRAMATLFSGADGSLVRVGWRDKKERLRSTTLRRAWHELMPGLRIQRLPDNYFVVEFDLFTDEVALNLTRAWRGPLQNARGVVFDLRGNGGGSAQAMADIASALLPLGTRLGTFTDRQGRVVLEPQTRGALLWAADTIPRFAGPVAVLTSARTASAAEVFVAMLRETGRARIVGQTTCGCVLAINRHALPDGGLLDVSEMSYHTATGAFLEGVGIAPDETVTVTRQEIIKGQDTALMMALKRLGR